MVTMQSKNYARWLLLLAICLMAFILNSDYLAVSMAMNPILFDLHSNLNTIQWILSGYMLAWATLVIPAGKLLDRYSRKQVSIVGTLIFIFASILAGLSTNAASLIGARMLQGGGGGNFSPCFVCYDSA